MCRAVLSVEALVPVVTVGICYLFHLIATTRGCVIMIARITPNVVLAYNYPVEGMP